MTLQEFKAWFEGFTENMGEAPPSKLQWTRIQARVKEIDGTAITYPVFIDRYWPPYSRWSTILLNGGGSRMVSSNMTTYGDHTFNATQAMCALGRADYADIQ